MKGICLITLSLLAGQAEALFWRANYAQQQLAFSFTPPAPVPMEQAPIEPATAVVSTETAEAIRDQQVGQMKAQVRAAADEAIGSVQEALNVHELPAGPAEEKQVKAREKGGFLSSILKKAAESFSSSSLTKLYGGEDVRQYQKEVIQTLEKRTPAAPLAQADYAELMEDETAPEIAPECPRNYSVQCPENFVADSTNCVALESYKGPCAKIQKDLYKLTDEQKAAWSVVCQDKFPCMPSTCPNGPNYKRKCPVGWTPQADDTCWPAVGRPPCDIRIKADASPEEKAAFEERCHVRWPCAPTYCSKDYSAICPTGWTQSGTSVCTPPAAYSGPCKQPVNMSDYAGRTDLKAAFERRCKASWPCNVDLTSRPRDYNAPCPLSWTRMGDGSCEAPPDFPASEECPRRISSEMSPSEKASFSLSCGADFPFVDRGNCPRDFSSRCPIGWTDLGDGTNCQAPEDYVGNCDRVAYFGRLNDEKKVEKMAECGVDWPCIGEWKGSLLQVVPGRPGRPEAPSLAPRASGAVDESGVVLPASRQ